jgi:hypothetical protein
MFIHSMPITNYAHNNQSIGQWAETSRNLLRLLAITKGLLLMQKLLRTRGFDFDTLEDDLNYGGNIYKDYDEKELLIAM